MRLDESVARRLRSEEYDRWMHNVASTGYCRNPVRLVGSSTTLHEASGEVLSEYSSTSEPDCVTFTRCGNRRATRFESCSHEHGGDTWHMIMAAFGTEVFVEEYDEALSSARISTLNLTNSQKSLMALVKKIFFQPGSGRREEALVRGTESDWDKAVADKVLQQFVAEGVLHKVKGDQGWVYIPRRCYTKRMASLVAEQKLSQDQYWELVSEPAAARRWAWASARERDAGLLDRGRQRRQLVQTTTPPDRGSCGFIQVMGESRQCRQSSAVAEGRKRGMNRPRPAQLGARRPALAHSQLTCRLTAPAHLSSWERTRRLRKPPLTRAKQNPRHVEARRGFLGPL